jgi:hypothetical protein
VQTAAMLNLPRPKQDGEKPTIRNAPATEELKAFVQSLAERAERLKTQRVDPSQDNMLKITSEGRKAALDLRLMRPAAPDDPQGKVSLAVENIHRIWQAITTERSAQPVFCELSAPKDRGFSVYRDMAEKLERLGISTKEVAFVQDFDSDASKLSLFRDVRSGRIRVLFGSTQKMGSGTNVQERLIALHHLDAPWRPADVEQREGRILRQGNKNAGVSVSRLPASAHSANRDPPLPQRRRSAASHMTVGRRKHNLHWQAQLQSTPCKQWRSFRKLAKIWPSTIPGFQKGSLLEV